MMLMDWGTLAVPTGIVTAEIATQRRAGDSPLLFQERLPPATPGCPACLSQGHVPQANFCFHCGAALP